MRPPREDTKPWYRQFWPWFLIALPGSVVVASMITIMLAADTDDALVMDDYYKEGLAINQDKARERNAALLGVSVTLSYDTDTATMIARLNDAAVGNLETLELKLAHPTLSTRDAAASLTAPPGEREFEGHIPLESAEGTVAWHVVVSPPEETWKIRGRWNPFHESRIVLSAPAQSD